MPTFPDDIPTPTMALTTFLPGQVANWETIHKDGMFIANMGRDLVMIRNDKASSIWYTIHGKGDCSMGFVHHTGPVEIVPANQRFETQLDMRRFNDIQGRAWLHLWADALGTTELPETGGFIDSVAAMVLRTSTLGGLNP